MSEILTNCKRCAGKGIIHCKRCKGSGLHSTFGSPTAIELLDARPCRACNGSGELKCPACEGGGKVVEYKVEEIDRFKSATPPAPSVTTSKFGIPDIAAFEKALSTYNRDGAPTSVIFFDLDNFKSVNDNHDHSVGDAVIKAAMNVIQGVINLKGSLFHRSGDEMLVLLPNFNEVEALAVGERIRLAIENHDFPRIGKGFVTATMGISSYPSSSCQSIGELEVHADRAAMSAKKQGKNLVVHAAQLDVNGAIVQAIQPSVNKPNARLIKTLLAELKRNCDVASMPGHLRTDFRTGEFERLDLSVLEDFPEQIKRAIDNGYGAVSVLQTSAKRLESRTSHGAFAMETTHFALAKEAQLPIINKAIETLKHYLEV